MDSVVEHWLPVKGFDGLYEVSNLGRVKSLRRVVPCVNGRTMSVRERILRPAKIKYYNVKLYLSDGHNKQQIQMKVHRLVLIAFVGEPPESNSEGNHKDGNKANNRLDNLEWQTPSGNQRHAYHTGLRIAPRGIKNPNVKLSDGDVFQIVQLLGKEKLSLIGRRFNVSKHVIWFISAGRTWSHLTGFSDTNRGPVYRRGKAS